MLTESISVTGLRLFKEASSLLNFPTLFLHMSFCLFSGRSPLAVSHLDPVLRRDAVGVKAPSLLTHTAWSMLRTQRTALTWVFCSLLPRSVYCSVPFLQEESSKQWSVPQLLPKYWDRSGILKGFINFLSISQAPRFYKPCLCWGIIRFTLEALLHGFP